ncbi:MAG: cbb3-type cytochrome c oxidase subunit I [Verrucomicrobiota bacterium]
MEVSLPISTAANPAPAHSAVSPAPSAGNAPAIKLPLAFMLTGLIALTTGAVWMVIRPAMLATYHYNQYVIALTHLFVLGWICSIVMGAMYQLVPVALETKLYSEKLARWQFAFHFVGFIGMVWMFGTWNLKQVGHFGSLLTVGVGLFVFNIFRTLCRVPKWNVTATAVTAALCWVSLTVFAGLAIATGKCVGESFDGSVPATNVGVIIGALRPLAGLVSRFDALSAMHAHAHLGGIGFFTMLIVGVSYKLIPMFTLSEVQSQRRAGLSVALLNLGLAGSFVTILLSSPWKLAFALVTIAALVIYGWELHAILHARKRRALDWGIRYFLTAVALLIPLSLAAVVLSWPDLQTNPLLGQLENLYGFVGLMGVVTLAIIGMLYKIIPFLVWFGVYSKHIGRAQVPALAAMYSPRLQMIGYWSFLVALVVISVGILCESEMGVRIGALGFTACVALLLVNVGKILIHVACPQITPLIAVRSFKPISA